MKFTNSNRVKINIWHYPYYYLYDQTYRQLLEHVDNQVCSKIAHIEKNINQEIKK